MADEKYEPLAYKAAQKIVRRLTPARGSSDLNLLDWLAAYPEEARLLDWIEANPIRTAELLWERAPFEFDPKGEVLYGHTDENTAYVVEDYPYGRHRTLMRYWLEYKKNKGYRFVSQTLNPTTKRWNKPHPSTYSDFLLMIRLFSNGHVHSTDPVSSGPLGTIRNIRAYGQSYHSEVWGEINAYLVAGLVYNLKTLKFEKKTGNSVWSINGVPQKANLSDLGRSYEHVLEYALALALVNSLRGK